MVNKSKLKMALLSENPVDFKKEHQKKMARKARKTKSVKLGKKVEGGEWEDVEDEEEVEEAGAENGDVDAIVGGEGEDSEEDGHAKVSFSHGGVTSSEAHDLQVRFRRRE